MDPLLLAGVVRVALDQIESNTKVIVRVHPQQAADARAYLLSTMDTQSMPEVVEDATLELDCCVLQTELGTAELGIEAQLKWRVAVRTARQQHEAVDTLRECQLAGLPRAGIPPGTAPAG